MATYFHGAPEMQPDGLQTLYLMNPANYDGYSDAAAPASANMFFLNSAVNSLNPMSISHNLQSNQHHQQQQQHLVGIPLQPAASIPNSQQVTAVHGFAPRLHYNLWTPAPAPAPAPATSSIDLPSSAPPQQGLSLSLSPQQTPFAPGSSSSAPAISNGVSGLQSVLMGSKYLKAAQLLLDEVVSVGNGTQSGSAKGTDHSKIQMKSSRESESVAQADTSANRAADLTTAERQELQTKKAKLVGMIDEVEQRYRQYRHQMEIVVSTFEAVAGFGAARAYTALALQTISKQFQCLRDAISGQIRATSKNLGEEVGGTKSAAGSRLRLVDHHLRQQRALQQLGMIQHNAWRPQRGLPERAVSVLRAWLFEHFLHPYPKDADKHMLARQTGLTRGQVSNWFINARVRLWKPMVEEMYMEEFKDQEQSNPDDQTASKSVDANEEESASQERSSPTRTEQTEILQTDQPIMQPCLIKRPRCDEAKQEMSNRNLFASHGAGFGAYPIEQYNPRFSGNSVSLTLGLQHSESLSLSGTQTSYLPTESNDYYSINSNNPTSSHPANPYDSINLQNRKRFGALLMPDFIA